MFRCPVMSDDAYCCWAYTSYGSNKYLSFPGDIGKIQRLSKLRRPAVNILLGDNYNNGLLESGAVGANATNLSTSSGKMPIAFRHGGKTASFGHADGSANSLGMNQVMNAQYWPALADSGDGLNTRLRTWQWSDNFWNTKTPFNNF